MFMVHLVGRIAAVGEYNNNGNKYLRIRMATTIKKRSGVDKTVWATVFTQQVSLEEYLKKGRQILVIGSSDIEHDDERKESDLVVNARHIELLADGIGDLLKKMAKAMGIADDSSRDQILAAVQKMAADFNALKATAEAAPAQQQRRRRGGAGDKPAEDNKEPVAAGAGGNKQDDDVPF